MDKARCFHVNKFHGFAISVRDHAHKISRFEFSERSIENPHQPKHTSSAAALRSASRSDDASLFSKQRRGQKNKLAEWMQQSNTK